MCLLCMVSMWIMVGSASDQLYILYGLFLYGQNLYGSIFIW
jgi:hypothetical protein